MISGHVPVIIVLRIGELYVFQMYLVLYIINHSHTCTEFHLDFRNDHSFENWKFVTESVVLGETSQKGGVDSLECYIIRHKQMKRRRFQEINGIIIIVLNQLGNNMG